MTEFEIKKRISKLNDLMLQADLRFGTASTGTIDKRKVALCLQRIDDLMINTLRRLTADIYKNERGSE